MNGSETTAIYVGKIYLSRNLSNSHEYAEGSHLYELLSQATKILLRKNGSISNQVMGEFLQQCNRGEHVLLKSYGSFSKSVMSKMCFLHNFLKIFEVDSIQRNGLDYYQLSRLLCSDFPRQFIHKAVGLLLPQEDTVNQMYKLLPSKKFTQAIYLFMIFGDYLDIITAHFQQEEDLDFLEVLRIVRQQDLKNTQQYTKPPFSIMAQGILSLMKSKGVLDQHESPLIFITQQNIEDFVRDATTNHLNKSVTLPEFLQQISMSTEYAKLVEDNLGMFQNSLNWANENYKILSTKEPLQTPLNVKKKGSKK